jgi:hypothetical protein
MELDLVTEFFRMAQAAFADAIVTGARVPAVQLGNGQNQRVYNIVDAYDWTYLSSIRDEGARYHPVWLRFAQWCEKNELTPVLTDAHNEEKGTWWLLTVKPTDASSAKTD